MHKGKSIQEAISQNDNDTIVNILKPNNLKDRSIVGPNSPTQALSSRIEKNSQTHYTMFNNVHKR